MFPASSGKEKHKYLLLCVYVSALRGKVGGSESEIMGANVEAYAQDIQPPLSVSYPRFTVCHTHWG